MTAPQFCFALPSMPTTERGESCSLAMWGDYLAYPAGNNVVLINLPQYLDNSPQGAGGGASAVGTA